MGRARIERIASDQGSPETSAAADVEIVDERDKNQGMAAANNAAGSGADTATLVLVGDAATEKDAILQRLGELHRLLNSRKGSLSATYMKNAEANDKACDLNQKTIQALDSLAEDYVVFEACHKRARGRRCDAHSGRRDGWRADCRMTWTVPTMAWLQPPGNSLIAGQHTRPRVRSIAAPSGKVCNRCATHDAICVEARKALHRTYEIKRKASEVQEGLATHWERTRRISNEHARAEGHVNGGIGTGSSSTSRGQSHAQLDVWRAGSGE